MSTVFDQVGSLQRLGNDPQLFCEMVAIVREDGPRRLRELQQALSENDLLRAHQAAHALKGLVATFGAVRAVAAAAAIEQQTKRADGMSISLNLGELEESLQQLLGALPGPPEPRPDPA